MHVFVRAARIYTCACTYPCRTYLYMQSNARIYTCCTYIYACTDIYVLNNARTYPCCTYKYTCMYLYVQSNARIYMCCTYLYACTYLYMLYDAHINTCKYTCCTYISVQISVLHVYIRAQLCFSHHGRLTRSPNCQRKSKCGLQSTKIKNLNQI